MAKIKKVFILILCLAFVVSSFIGCSIDVISKTEETTNQTEQDKDITITPKLIDGWTDIVIGETHVRLPKVIVIINNNVVRMPCTLKSFLEQSRLSISNTQTPPDNIAPSGGENIEFFNGDLMIGIFNCCSKSINANDCIVYMISSYYNGNSCQLPAGFAPVNQVTPKLIEEQFGKPNSEVDIPEENYKELEYCVFEETEKGTYGLCYEFCFQENRFWTYFVYGFDT